MRPGRHISTSAVREARAGYLLELWLISAVAAILAIRAYLSLTGYPQVGNGSLHIAHMLWGGLLLTVALGALLLFASRRWKPTAAIVGGLGFGTFIDELGKFITEDNDYFYQPAIALIYLVLIGLFLIGRTLAQRDRLSPREHIFYAVSALELLAMGRLDADSRIQALRHLDRESGLSGAGLPWPSLSLHAEKSGGRDAWRRARPHDRGAPGTTVSYDPGRFLLAVTRLAKRVRTGTVSVRL